MSAPSHNWKASVGHVNDPLAAFHKKPIISSGGTDATYVGRIVIEMWDTPEARDDADRIAITSDAVDGKHADLLVRLAKALPSIVQRGTIKNQ